MKKNIYLEKINLKCFNFNFICLNIQTIFFSKLFQNSKHKSEKNIGGLSTCRILVLSFSLSVQPLCIKQSFFCIGSGSFVLHMGHIGKNNQKRTEGSVQKSFSENSLPMKNEVKCHNPVKVSTRHCR